MNCSIYTHGKHLIYGMTICLFLMVMMLVGTVRVSAADIRKVTANSLKVRSGASTSAAAIGGLTKGEKVTCLGASGDWMKIKFDGGTGYVALAYLTKAEEKTTVAATAEKADTITNNTATTYKRYVKADFLSIRKGPSVLKEAIGEYVYGDKITCYGKEGNWTIVKYNGQKAYVYTSYLVKENPGTTPPEEKTIDKVVNAVASVATTAKKVTAYTMYVNCTDLNVRAKADSKSKIIAVYYTGDAIKCYGTKGDWTKVICDEGEGYMFTSYLSKNKVAKDAYESNGKGSDVAAYAKKYLGLRYVWGGESLTKGADCSGFTKAIYKHFGYNLPHSSVSQRSSGFAVSSADRKPGDLICYNQKNGVGHVGIYIGNNQVIHASGEKTGVKISTWNYRSVNCVRRLIK
ncbi:MAG: SH3 domain-containing protein [Lachnospiraceae bacterium]|nr:SH3 domain-containing protein [Lachnospiraceae bacterium]